MLFTSTYKFIESRLRVKHFAHRTPEATRIMKRRKRFFLCVRRALKSTIKSVIATSHILVWSSLAKSHQLRPSCVRWCRWPGFALFAVNVKFNYRAAGMVIDFVGSFFSPYFDCRSLGTLRFNDQFGAFWLNYSEPSDTFWRGEKFTTAKRTSFIKAEAISWVMTLCCWISAFLRSSRMLNLCGCGVLSVDCREHVMFYIWNVFWD